jgi:Ser/Thr protein kinase RdoA (MazF antagonist)
LAKLLHPSAFVILKAMTPNPTQLPIAASHSTLSGPELLAQVVCHYKVDKPLACLFWTRGINDTYQVQCANARYSLRVYRHAFRSRDDIEFEIAALNYLRSKGADVAYPIQRKDGGYITEVIAPEGSRYIILTTHAEGELLKYDEPEDSRRFGESVATLHKLSEGFTTHYQRKTLDLSYLLAPSLDAFRPYLTEHPEDLAFVEQVAEEARAVVTARPIESLDSGFCHGDFHGGNVHEANDVLTHYDFDCCGLGLRIYDLATFKWDATLSGTEEQRWPHFLEGYRSVRDLSDSELELLNSFVVIRHFWWIGQILGKVGGFEYDMTDNESIDDYLRYLKKIVSKDGDAE